MSKPITGKTTISVWKQKRKNGDIYVWERQTVYIPETRKTKELSRKLLGKIPAGSTDGEIVPTRPKRKRPRMQYLSPRHVQKLDQLRFCVGSASKAVLQKICSLAWMRARLKR